MEQQTCDAVHGDAEDTPFRADRASKAYLRSPKGLSSSEARLIRAIAMPDSPLSLTLWAGLFSESRLQVCD